MNFLSFNQIIANTRNNRQFPTKYLTDLFNYVNDNLNLPIKCDNPLTAIKCFIPLPSRLLLSELYTNSNSIIKINNEYQFHGLPGNRIIFSDKILPFQTNDIKMPIPFSFPIYDDEHIDIVLSNVFYYELTIDNKKNISATWDQECISIGFGHKYSKFNSHVGWYDNSVGYHSDDGSIRKNNTSSSTIINCNKWNPGDTVGAGIIFTKSNTIKPFFTFNGKIVYLFEKSFEIKNPYFPIIGYDHSHSIKLNFSTHKFKFNIKKFILENSNNSICTENTFSTNHDIGSYLNEHPTTFNKENNYNNLINQLSDKFNIVMPETNIISNLNEIYNNLNGISNNLNVIPNNNITNNVIPNITINNMTNNNIPTDNQLIITSSSSFYQNIPNVNLISDSAINYFNI